METKEHPFTGIWYAAVQENRVDGKWEREYEFAPGEWLISFTPQGNYLETFRPEGKRTVSRWKFDESTGIISIFSDPSEFTSQKCVFEGGWLYYYDDLPYIPKNAAAIVGHHAWERLRLVKIEE